MGWFDYFRRESRTIENPAVPISSASIMEFLGLAERDPSGVKVTVDSAIKQSVVWTCVRVLGETLASLPLQVFERTETGKILKRDHPLYVTLHDSPNVQLTSFVFFETMVALASFYGNAYALIQRAGNRTNLWILPPSMVSWKATDAGLVYEIRYPDGTERVPAEDMIHVPGTSLDGLSGVSLVLKAGREAVGLAIAAELHSAKFFSNGARVGGVLSTDQALSDVALTRLKASWGAMQAGIANAYKTAVLEQGLKYQAVGMQSDHAQLVETRRLQTELIAGLFRIPPMFVGDWSQSHYANAEHSDLHLAKHTMSPWCKRFEQELNRKLFVDDPTHFCEFNLDGLLRGDFKTRTEGYARALGGPGAQGYMTVNEVRALENMPPIAGGEKLIDASPPPPPKPGTPPPPKDDAP